MVAMELKLLRLEAKLAHQDSRRQRRQPNTNNTNTTTAPVSDRLQPILATPSTPKHSDEELDSFEELELTPRGTNRHQDIGSAGSGAILRGGGVLVTRSGASVASAVTATSFQEGEFSHAMNEDGRSNDGDIEDEGGHNSNDDASSSTPTPNSRNRISNLESILHNPTQAIDRDNSTNAVRGETDAASSLPTSVTSNTVASTVVTATTRGGESVGITRISSRTSEENVLHEDVAAEGTGILHETSTRLNSEEYALEARAEGHHSHNNPPLRTSWSRSQSPLTVQSTNHSITESASLGLSALSTAAVAPACSFGTRRAHAATANANADAAVGYPGGGSRPVAHRGRRGDSGRAGSVVSFTNTTDLNAAFPVNMPDQRSNLAARHHPSQEQDGGGDSITMPDELDNFSDVAETFSTSARAWREEYEARLDAIHKRLGN